MVADVRNGGTQTLRPDLLTSRVSRQIGGSFLQRRPNFRKGKAPIPQFCRQRVDCLGEHSIVGPRVGVGSLADCYAELIARIG